MRYQTSYFAMVRELSKKNNIGYRTVKGRLDRGIPLKFALMENPFEIIHKEQEKLKNKPMRYWIVRNHQITVEER